MKPRVTVVVPLFQTERYIADALSSVLAQTFRDFEVVVVDDGSHDQGPRVAASTGDSRVRVVRQENRGLAGARNTGIRNARADIVALLDADDLWEADKLERHIAHLDADLQLDISFSASRLIDDDGRDVGLVQSPLDRTLADEEFFCRNPVGNGSAPVIRKRALGRIAFPHPERGDTCWFDESFRQSEDIECWMRLKAAGARFGYVDAALTRYRVNSGGLSANVSAQLATWRRFRDKVAIYAPELVARYGKRAEAYQLRYLARRAIRSADPHQGLELVAKAISLHPRIVVEEPARTLATLAAAMAKRLLPQSLFCRLEVGALRVTGSVPGLRV